MTIQSDFIRSDFQFKENAATEKVTVQGKVYVVTVTGVADEATAQEKLKDQVERVVSLAIAYGVGQNKTTSIDVTGNALTVNKEGKAAARTVVLLNDGLKDIQFRQRHVFIKGNQYNTLLSVMKSDKTPAELLERIKNKALTDEDLKNLEALFEELMDSKIKDNALLNAELKKILTKENWELGEEAIAKKLKKWTNKYKEIEEISTLYGKVLPKKTDAAPQSTFKVTTEEEEQKPVDSGVKGEKEEMDDVD